jgi:hypothetical protein
MQSKTLPTLNKVIIKHTVHYIVHLQCTFSVSLSSMYESKGSWCFSTGMGTKENKSSAGHILAAEFHHVMACSRLMRILNLTKCFYFFNFPNF